MSSHQVSRRAARQGLFMIVLAAMLWGTVGVATKGLYQLSETNPLSIGFFRLALSVPVLLVVCWRMLGWRAFRVAWRDLGVMLIIGVATALYQVCYFASIAQVGVTISVLITLCTAPVIVALLSALLLRERLSRMVKLAMVCALAGTLLLVGIPEAGGVPLEKLLHGVLLSLGSATGYAIMVIGSRSLAHRCHPLVPLTYSFAFAALMLLPFALWAGLVVQYPLLGWVLLLHLGLLPTALAYVLFFFAMRVTSATSASIITLLEPLTSTVLAWLLFGERLGPGGLVGAVLLLAAIGLLYRSESQQEAVPVVPQAGQELGS